MIVINRKGEIITDYDLTKGRLITRKRIRADAEPIDNKTKFSWTKDDYEEVQMYIPNREKSKAEKIRELKSQLSATDYKVIKCSECQLLGQEMPYDVTKLHAERQAIRDQINQLEAEV
jgi:hypothetical protein